MLNRNISKGPSNHINHIRKMGVTSLLVYTGLTVNILWAVKSTIAYFTWSEADCITDISTSPLLGFWGMKPELISQIANSIVAPYFAHKQTSIRTHMVVSLIITVFLTFQLVQPLRKKFLWLHRLAGQAVLTFVLFVGMPTFVPLVANFKSFSPPTSYTEYIIVFLIPLFGVKGWIEARNKNIPAHRSSMIMFASCFFYFGVQRIVLVVLSALHVFVAESDLSPLGPFRTMTYDEYRLVFFPGASTIAIAVTFGVGGFKAYNWRLTGPGKAK